MTYNSVDILLCIYPREAKPYNHTKTCTLLVLYWTGTWWSGVDDERVKEGKRLIFPGLCSQISCSRESARNSERERERERNRDPSSNGAKVF